ncbi:MAG: CapA family protein [Pseudomonadota bacterium]|jgi:poly-gamma-glutamate synthesis protein (capsule biosynthesis protein)
MQRFFLNIPLTALVILFSAVLPPEAFGGSVPSMYVVLLGDFLPGASASEIISKRGYSYLFDGVRNQTRGMDTIFLNLETPLSRRGHALEKKTYTFRSSPDVAAVLRQERVFAVHLANNHILDFGVEALADTFSNLKRAGVAYAGAGQNWYEASLPALVNTPVGKVRFVAFSNTLPESYWAKRDRPGTLYGSQKAVVTTLSRHRGTGPLVASFHWGAELMTEPKEYQVDLARLAIDSGATLVVGHHPHVPQPIDVYNGVPILYSLGNFAFGSYSKRAPYGLMAIAEFDEGGRCTLLEIYPLNTDNSQVAFSPRPVTGPEGQEIFNTLVEGIDLSQASILWDGEKGVIVPKGER